MTKKYIIAVAVVAATATPTVAQEISGASVSGAYKYFTDDDADLEITSLRAGIEVGLAPSFAVGGNFATFNNGDSEDTVFNATLHGMYMLSPDSALGLFAAQEANEDADVTMYGFEGASSSVNTHLEGYFGFVDSDDLSDNDLTIAGFSFEFNISGGLMVGIDYESYRIEDGFAPPASAPLEDLTIRDTALTARYQFDNDLSVFAELGQINSTATSGDTVFVSAEDAEYVTIGATYSFGRSGGNLLGERTILGFGG